MSTVPIKAPSGGGAGGLPAARVTDLHVCPMPIHVGGPVLPPGAPTVFIEGLPAARLGDLCQCVIGPPDVINKGSATVYIGSKKAARMTDTTAHGGVIAVGAVRTFIGDGAGAGGAGECMKQASDNGSATIEM